MSIRHRVRTFIVLAGVAAGSIGLTAGTAYGSRGTSPRADGCVPHLTSAHDEGITLATSPPAGGDVAPGSTVTITSRWDAGAWEELDKILMCVTSDGTYTAALSATESAADNDGEIVWTMTVPAAAMQGTELCMRSVIFGIAIDAPEVQKSEFGCLRVVSGTAAPQTSAPPSNDQPDPGIEEAAATEGPAPEPLLITSPEVNVEAQPETLAELPRTGSPTGTLGMAGAAAILVGGLASFAGRRTRSTSAT